MKFQIYKILLFFLISSALTANNFSLSFDGQDDYVDLGQNLLSGTGDFSISLWANSSSNSGDQILIQKRDSNGFNGEYLLLFKANGTIKIWTYRNGYKWTVVSPEAYNDGEWHHIVAVQDNSINGGRLYVDGIEVGSSSNGVVNLMGSLRTYLGADMRDSIFYLNGLLDNVMIYSDVLTIDEIVSLFNNDNSLNDNIVGYWNCNSGSGDILYDQSGNANNGTISGVLWSTNTPSKSIYVSTLGSDENGDGSEEDPYFSIQKGIDAASEVDTVLVSAGTYVENINFNGKNVKVIGESKENTIIDGNQNGSVVTFDNSETNDALLMELTIQNGQSDYGGGVFCSNSSSPTLKNMLIKNNSGNSGGGVYLHNNSNAVLDNLFISNNSSPSGDGGGVYVSNSNPILKNSIINNNISSGFGGIGCVLSSPMITNVIIRNNEGSSGGGFACMYNSFPILENVSIINNSATDLGGGIYCWDSYPELTNVTIVNNTALQSGAIHVKPPYEYNSGYIYSHVRLTNSIVWNNDPQENNFADTLTISYSILQGGESSLISNGFTINGPYENTINWGQGNLDSNPRFMDSDNQDYRLSDISPAIGAGAMNGAPSTDIEGNPRPNPAGSNPDMGAYENSLGTAETIIYGDVTMNGTVSSYDASQILRHVVFLDTLSYVQQFLGDVSQNNELSSLDASYILQYVVGLIDELPYTSDNVLAHGEFIMENITASIGETISIPIRIINDFNIRSFSGVLNYNHEVLLLDTITTGDYYSNSILMSNKKEEGDVYIASSGFTPNEGFDEVAIAIFTVLDRFNGHTTVSITDLKLNENSDIESVVSMSINSILNIDQQLPINFTLCQNYPNPFNPTTKIRYYLPFDKFVNIIIYDIKGNKIKSLVNQEKPNGYHTVKWDGTNTAGELVSGGMYFYLIDAGSFKQTKKMVLVK